MEKYTRTIKDKGNAELRKVSIAAFGALVKRSPVDTARFRGNWKGAVGSPDISINEATQPGTVQGSRITLRESANITPALQAQIGQDVFISNNLPYGGALENGHSAQAPAGVLHITTLQIQSQLDAR